MKKSLHSHSIPLFLSILTILLTAYSSNPPEDYSGAPPFNQTCASCHGGGNNFDGEITLSGLPDNVEPETDYTITIKVDNPNGLATRAGFQLVSIDEDNNNTGIFGATTGGAATQEANNRTYVEHRGAQAFDANNEAIWTVAYRSPSASVMADSIKLYATGNIANGGGTFGDRIVSTTSFFKVGTDNPPLVGDIQVNQNTTCNNGADGSATVSMESGTPPYSYVWSNNAGTTATVNNLAAGIYNVTITDAANESLVLSTTITEPAPIAINIEEKGDVDCTNTFGFIRVIANNGAGNYNYQWSNGVNGRVNNQLAVGSYTVTVTDANNCQNALTINIQDLSVTPNAEAGQPYTLNCDNTSTTLSAAGSSVGNNISYSWEAASGGNIVSGANTMTPVVNQAGFYILTVTNNGNGCTATDNVDVFVDFDRPTAIINSPDFLTCNGSAVLDGTSSVGSGSLTYQWSASNGGNIIGDPTATRITINTIGTYRLRVTNTINGCSDETLVTIQSANQPDAMAAVSNVINCNDATATISANGSSTGNNITYQWTTTNGRFVGSTDVFSTIVDAGGTYTLTVTDNDTDCSSSTTIEVTQDTNLPDIDAGEAAIIPCNNDRVRLDARNSAQGANLSYQWTASSGGNIIGGATSLRPTVNAAGSYTLTITNNNNGCIAIDRVVVTNATPPIANAGNDANLGCTGSMVTLNGIASSQGDNLIYSWATTDGNIVSGESTLEPTVDATGTYTLSIFNISTGCSAADEVEVNIAEGFDLSVSARTDILCHSAATGSATVNPQNGAAPFSYLWSNGATTATNNNLNAGSYTVTVNDANGCSSELTIELTEPDSIILELSANAETQAGANDGRAQAIPNGGVSPYTFNWSNGAITAFINNLPPDSYTVTVTDANGCTAIETTTVNAANCSLQTISFNATGTTCNGGMDGTANIIISGGLTPYNYLWSNGATTANINNLTAGSYGVTVTDAGNCSIESSIIVTEPTALILTESSVFNVRCNGGVDGSAIVQATGGTGDYEFQWSSGSQTNVQQNLAAGTHTVTVFDSNGCFDAISITVTEPSALTVSLQSSDESEMGAQDGTANAVGMGGNAPYQYRWSNNATQSTISNLTAGAYTVTVTDANNCTVIGNVTIEAGMTTNNLAAGIGNIMSPDCFGENTGTAEVIITSGTAPYSYNWSNGTTTAINNNLNAGAYAVTVTDANNNMLVLTTTITEPSPITSMTSGSNTSTSDATDGTATVMAMGGTPPYQYLWSNNATTATINNLPTGSYSVTVSDDNNCTVVDNIAIEADMMTSLNAAITTTSSPSCFGDSNGAVEVVIASGTVPYIYNWSNGATTATNDNLSAGTYTVTITDANDNMLVLMTTLTQPSALALNLTSTNESMAGAADGTATAMVNGGTSPYQYLWSNNATTATINNLSTGSYTVTVTDANDCSIIDNIDVITNMGNNSLQATIGNIVPATCFGAADGFAEVIITAGTDPYDFLWSNGVTTAENSNLLAGDYAVTITDNASETLVLSVTITQPEEITLATTTTNVTSSGANDGTATANASGGTPPYRYEWSNGAMGQSIGNLATGNYSVTVIDNQNCEVFSSFTINDAETDCSSFAVDLLGIAPTCFGGFDGQIIITDSMGFDIESISLDAPNINQLIASDYNVSVTDSRGCTTSVVVNVPEADTLTVEIFSITPATDNAANGTATIIVSGQADIVAYAWVGSNMQVISTEKNPTNLPPDTYELRILYNDNCIKTVSNIVIDNITNTTEPSILSSLSVFPNPTQAIVSLSIRLERKATVQWFLHDFTGRKLHQSIEQSIKDQSLTVDLNNYSSGVYWLKIQIGEEWVVRKVIKN